MNNKLMDVLYRFKLITRRLNSNDYINYLQSKGIKIGKNTVFFDPISNFVDTQRPWMLSIGDYCKITRGVIILQHDYSRSVLRKKYGEIIAESRPTIIGNNVFIGMNSIILMGSTIGDNVIIGAGSVVSGNIPSNAVCAGNPCKVIKSLSEHQNQRKKSYISEAINQAVLFKKIYSRYPSIEEMGAFFPLYLSRDDNEIEKNNINLNLSGDNYEEIYSNFMNSKPLFNSYDEFLNECKKYEGEKSNEKS